MIQTNEYLIPNFTSMLVQCEEDMLYRLKDNQPSVFHLNSGGNRSRAKLCIHAGLALELPTKAIIALASTIELLHNASLVHDDLQDAEKTRRGRPSVWKKYGKSQAICTGDLMISAAFGALADIEQSEHLGALLQQTNKAVSTTIHGQARDIEVQSTIDVKEYEEIAAMKSGPLIQLTLALPLLMSDNENAIEIANSALNKFAIAYQIVDDLDDWEQDLQNGQLNLVNLLISQCSLEEATYIARNRAQYLLKQCEKELRTLPNNCAKSVIKASADLLAKAQATDVELT